MHQKLGSQITPQSGAGEKGEDTGRLSTLRGVGERSPSEIIGGRRGGGGGGGERPSGFVTEFEGSIIINENLRRALELTKLGRSNIQEKQRLASGVRQQLSRRDLSRSDKLQIKRDFQSRIGEIERRKQVGEQAIRGGKSFQDIQRVEEPRVKPDSFRAMVDASRQPERETLGQRFLSSLTPQRDVQVEKTFKTLFKEGDFPSIVRKGFFKVGEVIQTKVTSPLEKVVTGTRPTKAQEKVLSRLTGETLMFAGLIPLAGTTKFIDKKITISETMSRKQALAEFSRLSEAQQLKILEKSIRFKEPNIQRVFTSRKQILETVEKTIPFMRRAGLTEVQIKQRIASLLGTGESFGGVTTTITRPPMTQTVSTRPVTLQSSGSQLLQFQAPQTTSLGFASATIQQTQTAFRFATAQDSAVAFDSLKAQDTLFAFDTLKAQDTLKEQETQRKRGQVFIPQTDQIFRDETIKEKASRKIFIPAIPRSIRTRMPTEEEILRSRPQKPKQPKKPKKPKIPIVPFGLGSFKEAIEFVKKGGDAFEIFTRKAGEDIKVGTGKTEEGAFGKLFGKLTKELRASGFVKKGGKKIKPKALPFGFGISKVDPFRIVEKKERRLKKGTQETKEIQFFRKSGKKRK